MRQIRRAVFETNSSSVHTITICTSDDYQKFKDGTYMLDTYNSKLVTYSDSLHLDNPYQYKTYDEYYEDWDLDTYTHHFTTSYGDEMIAFGKYGRD